MKTRVLISSLGLMVFGLFSFASASFATVDGAMSTRILNFSEAETIRNNCLVNSNGDDYIEAAFYVGSYVAPRFYYEYYNTDDNWYGGIQDTTEMLIYNPNNLSSNGSFNFLSNICPATVDRVAFTAMNDAVQVIDNNGDREDMAVLYATKGVFRDYKDPLIGGTAGNYAYRTDYDGTLTTVDEKLSQQTNDVTIYSCKSVYIARCGDGVRDYDGITIQGEQGYMDVYGISGDEVCDGSDLGPNAPAGAVCNSTCDGYEETTEDPVCLDIEDPVVVNLDVANDENYFVTRCQGDENTHDILLRIYEPGGYYYMPVSKPADANNSASFYSQDFYINASENLNAFAEYYGCDQPGINCEAKCFVRGTEGAFIEPTTPECETTINLTSEDPVCTSTSWVGDSPYETPDFTVINGGDDVEENYAVQCGGTDSVVYTLHVRPVGGSELAGSITCNDASNSDPNNACLDGAENNGYVRFSKSDIHSEWNLDYNNEYQFWCTVEGGDVCPIIQTSYIGNPPSCDLMWRVNDTNHLDAGAGDLLDLRWHIAGDYNTPATIEDNPDATIAFPYDVPQADGNRQFTVDEAGDYTFSMRVENAYGYDVCTATLHIEDDIPDLVCPPLRYMDIVPNPVNYMDPFLLSWSWSDGVNPNGTESSFRLIGPGLAVNLPYTATSYFMDDYYPFVSPLQYILQVWRDGEYIDCPFEDLIVTGNTNLWIEKTTRGGDLVFPSGGTVSFRIDFGNSGNVATWVDVFDMLPDTLTYLTSAIYYRDGTPWGAYSLSNDLGGATSTTAAVLNSEDKPGSFLADSEFAILDDEVKEVRNNVFSTESSSEKNDGGDLSVGGTKYSNFYHTDHYFAYSGLYLEPGMSGYVIVTAVISDDCNGVYWNTGFIDDSVSTLSSQDDFECTNDIFIEKLQSVNGSEFTGLDIFVEPYDYITYRINFSTEIDLNDVFLYDLMPEGVVFITGTTSINSANPMFSGWAVGGVQEFVQSQDFDLLAGQGGYAIITGQVVSGFESFQTEYWNTASLSGVSSSVVAILTGNLPQLSIEKELTNTGFYISEKVGFRISFANTGYMPATGVMISDILPASLDLQAVSIYGVVDYDGPVVTSLEPDGATQIVYSNVEIAPFSSGYILITGTVQHYDGETQLCDSSTNYVFMSGSVLDEILWDDANFDCYPFSIEKFVTNLSGDNLNINGVVPNYISGDTVYFEIQVEGISEELSIISLQDVRPDSDENCVEYLGWAGDDWTQTVSSVGGLTRTYNGDSNSSSLFLSGLIVSDEDECIGDFVNTGVLIYGDYTDEDDARFAISHYNLVINKTADMSGMNYGDLVTFYLEIENRGTEPVNHLVISDIWPGTLNIVPDPSLTVNRYDYDGLGTITSTSITEITGGLLLEWFFDPSFNLLPGETGLIVLTGRLSN